MHLCRTHADNNARSCAKELPAFVNGEGWQLHDSNKLRWWWWSQTACKAMWCGRRELRGVQVMICFFSKSVSQSEGTEARRKVLMGWVGQQS